VEQHLAESILVDLRHEVVGGVGMGGMLVNRVGYLVGDLVDEWLVQPRGERVVLGGHHGGTVLGLAPLPLLRSE
jgi:hypothetical protein